MRYWRMLVVMAGMGAAAAQDRPAQPPVDWQKRTQALDRAFRLGLAQPAQRPGKAAPQPAGAAPRRCAIPLVNVLKPAPGAPAVRPDPMIVVPRGPAPSSREEVRVPAPSCDDIKK